MKKIGLIIFFLISVCIGIGVLYTHEKTRNIPKSSDSIIVYFQTIFVESYTSTGINNIIKYSDRLQPNDTILLSHKDFRWVLIIIFFEILIPPEPFMRDAPHFFYRKYNKNLL